MTPTPEILGKRLRQVRVANGLSQAEMAKRMAFGPDGGPIVSKIEGGKRKVAADELHRWATICGVSVDALLNGTPFVIEAAS